MGTKLLQLTTPQVEEELEMLEAADSMYSEAIGRGTGPTQKYRKTRTYLRQAREKIGHARQFPTDVGHQVFLTDREASALADVHEAFGSTRVIRSLRSR